MKSRLLLTAVMAAALPWAASAAPHFRGRIYVGPSYLHGFYGPYWGSPFYSPYSPYGWGYVEPDTGKVKIETHEKEAQVFIDGSYAGTAGKLKSMNLRPGDYTISVRAPNGQNFERRIYVVRGKTVDLKPEF